MILKTDLEKYGITLNNYCEFLGIEVDSFTYSNKIKSLSPEFEDKNNVFNYLALNVFNLANNFLAQMPEKLQQDSFSDFKNVVGDINAENLRRCVFEEIKFRVINNILPELAYKKYFNGNLNYNADQNWNYQNQENFLNPQAILYLKNSNWNATIDNFEDYRLVLSDKQDKLSAEQLEAIEAVKNKANITDLEAKQDKLSPEQIEKINSIRNDYLTEEDMDNIIESVADDLDEKEYYYRRIDFEEYEREQNQKVEALSSTVETLENRPNLTAEQLEAIEAVKNKADLSDLTEKYRELSGQISTLDAQKLNSTDLDSHLSPINAEIEKLKNSSQNNEKINNLVERLGSTQGQVGTLIESTGQFENQISELNEKVQNLENSNRNYTQRFTTLSSQIETNKSNDDANIQRLEQAITNATTELNNAKRKAAQLESALTVNTEADAETLNKFNKLNAEYSKNLQQVRNDILTNNQSISNLAQSVERAEQTLGMSSTILSGLEENKADKSDLSDLNGQFREIKSKVAELEIPNNMLISDVMGTVDELGRQVAELQNGSSNSGQISTLSSKIQRIESSLSTQLPKIVQIEDNNATINRKVSNVEQEVANLKKRPTPTGFEFTPRNVDIQFNSSQGSSAFSSKALGVRFTIQIGDREFDEFIWMQDFDAKSGGKLLKSYFTMLHSKGIGVIIEYTKNWNGSINAKVKDARTLYNDSGYSVTVSVRNVKYLAFRNAGFEIN